MVMALLLDLANIVGGFLLAAALGHQVPAVGERLWRARARLHSLSDVVGVVALVSAGYWTLVHVTAGPRLFHFELVGLAVGLALLWERLTGRPRPGQTERTELGGAALLLAIVGLIAVVVGVQGLFTPDG